MGNPTLVRFIRRNIYGMKRQYGDRVDVYKVLSSTTDHLTGEKTVVKQVHSVKRAPVLPSRTKRTVEQTISVISAGKAFVYGGTFDSSLREIIIDSRDLPPGYEIVPEDYIVYNHKRWDIIEIEKFEVDTGWVIKVRHNPGQPSYEIFDMIVSSDMSLVEGVETDPNAYQMLDHLAVSGSVQVIKHANVQPITDRLMIAQNVIATVE